VDLDLLALTVEPAGEMLPAGFDLRHLLGRLKPLAVPTAGCAFASEIRLVDLVPVDDVADDVMHRWTSLSLRSPCRPSV
jgi:hypothetical protein